MAVVTELEGGARLDSGMQRDLVLSLFPGVGLLDRAFELEGFVVVRGPDLLWGGDVRRFDPPPGIFAGVVGGPPCQDFSSARRRARTLDGYGASMLAEFVRVVQRAAPAWWLLENVDGVPDVRVAGYGWQRLDVEQGWFCPVRRLRHVQFGHRGGAMIDVPRGRVVDGAEPAALACDGRTFEELRRLQGVEDGWDLPGFTIEAKRRAVGNGVPLVLGRVLARAVRVAVGLQLIGGDPPSVAVVTRWCGCGCGRPVRGLHRYVDASCRKRAQRRRDSAGGGGVAGGAAANVTELQLSA